MRKVKKDKYAILMKVERLGDCWIWKAGKTSKGYGDVTVSGERLLAHRLSYEVFRGPIPDGILVLHSCDVPACVNPDHLFLGTNADNLRDASEKGRLNPASKKNLVPWEGELCRAGLHDWAQSKRDGYGGRPGILVCWECRKDALRKEIGL